MMGQRNGIEKHQNSGKGVVQPPTTPMIISALNMKKIRNKSQTYETKASHHKKYGLFRSKCVNWIQTSWGCTTLYNPLKALYSKINIINFDQYSKNLSTREDK
jgi:hypothetical protein